MDTSFTEVVIRSDWPFWWSLRHPLNGRSFIAMLHRLSVHRYIDDCPRTLPVNLRNIPA
jgi:hypothetical protein